MSPPLHIPSSAWGRWASPEASLGGGGNIFSWSIDLHRNRLPPEVCKAPVWDMFARRKPYSTGFVKRIRHRRDQGREGPGGSSRRPVFRPSSEVKISTLIFVGLFGCCLSPEIGSQIRGREGRWASTHDYKKSHRRLPNLPDWEIIGHGGFSCVKLWDLFWNNP